MTPETKEICETIVNDYKKPSWRMSCIKGNLRLLKEYMEDFEERIARDEDDDEIMANGIRRLAAVVTGLSKTLASYADFLKYNETSVRGK